MAKRFERPPVDPEVIAERRRRLQDLADRFDAAKREYRRAVAPGVSLKVSEDARQSVQGSGVQNPDETSDEVEPRPNKRARLAAKYPRKTLEEYQAGEFRCDRRERRFTIAECMDDYTHVNAFALRDKRCFRCPKGKAFRDIFSET